MLQDIWQSECEEILKEMNTIISFVVGCPLEFVRPFMEIVETAERQKELWILK